VLVEPAFWVVAGLQNYSARSAGIESPTVSVRAQTTLRRSSLPPEAPQPARSTPWWRSRSCAKRAPVPRIHNQHSGACVGVLVHQTGHSQREVVADGRRSRSLPRHLDPRRMVRLHACSIASVLRPDMAMRGRSSAYATFAITTRLRDTATANGLSATRSRSKKPRKSSGYAI
jgi:hypothetical protein